MESSRDSNCLLECAVGIKDLLQSPEKDTLEETLEKDGVKQRFSEKMKENYCGKSKQKKVHDSSHRNRQRQNEGSSADIDPNSIEDLADSFRDLFVVGQDIATDSIKTFTRLLLERDYQEIANFNGVIEDWSRS